MVGKHIFLRVLRRKRVRNSMDENVKLFPYSFNEIIGKHCVRKKNSKWTPAKEPLSGRLWPESPERKVLFETGLIGCQKQRQKARQSLRNEFERTFFLQAFGSNFFGFPQFYPIYSAAQNFVPFEKATEILENLPFYSPKRRTKRLLGHQFEMFSNLSRRSGNPLTYRSFASRWPCHRDGLLRWSCRFNRLVRTSPESSVCYHKQPEVWADSAQPNHGPWSMVVVTKAWPKALHHESRFPLWVAQRMGEDPTKQPVHYHTPPSMQWLRCSLHSGPCSSFTSLMQGITIAPLTTRNTKIQSKNWKETLCPATYS